MNVLNYLECSKLKVACIATKLDLEKRLPCCLLLFQTRMLCPLRYCNIYSYSVGVLPIMRSRWLFPSRATLVLCPSHIAKQWVSEANSHISRNLKVTSPTRTIDNEVLGFVVHNYNTCPKIYIWRLCFCR